MLYRRSIKEEKTGAQNNENFLRIVVIYNETKIKPIFHKILSFFVPKKRSIKNEANPLNSNQETNTERSRQIMFL
jgi:hypothetical protein